MSDHAVVYGHSMVSLTRLESAFDCERTDVSPVEELYHVDDIECEVTELISSVSKVYTVC